MENSANQHPASFRDPFNCIIEHKDEVYRVFFDDSEYCQFAESGLLEKLHDLEWLVSTRECPEILSELQPQFLQPIKKVLKTDKLCFISDPYQWSFYQLKKAAILTLQINIESLKNGMVLKDASAFNVQFRGSKPVFIDTGSFTKYKEGEPWQAYGQFCRHFLAPLLLMKYKSPGLNKLFLSNIDGIPLSIASQLLPRKTHFNFFIWSNIHYHSKLDIKFQKDVSFKTKKLNLPKSNLLNIQHHLLGNIEKLELSFQSSQWLDYYESEHNYSDFTFKEKETFILKNLTSSATLIDFGCNTGHFTKLLKNTFKSIIAIDSDHHSINKLCIELNNENNINILPLVEDICNPSPAIGWSNTERSSFLSKINNASGLALALEHHLFISNNISFKQMADLFASMCIKLIIEFVHENDSQIKKLTVSRQLDCNLYNIENFKIGFQTCYSIIEEKELGNKTRTLFYMKRRGEVS